MLKLYTFSIFIFCSLTATQFASAGPVIEPLNSTQEQFNISQSNDDELKVLKRIEVEGEELNLKLRLNDLETNGSIYDYALVSENGWPVRPQAAEKPYFVINFEGEYRLVREKALSQRCNAEGACLERFNQDISFGEQGSSTYQENDGNGSKPIELDQADNILTYLIIGILMVVLGSLTFLRLTREAQADRKSF